MDLLGAAQACTSPGAPKMPGSFSAPNVDLKGLMSQLAPVSQIPE